MALPLLKDEVPSPVSPMARHVSDANWAAEIAGVINPTGAFAQWEQEAIIDSIIDAARAKDLNKAGLARRFHSHGVSKSRALDWASALFP